MTIDERADKAMRQRSADYLQPLSFEFKNGYEQGATEQKAIDDDHLREVKKMVIDKSCEWLKQQGKDWWEGYGIPFSIEDYRKAMMEEQK